MESLYSSGGWGECMTSEKQQEIMRRQNEAMQAMSQMDMTRRQLENAGSMQNAYPLTSGQQEAMRNAWGGREDETQAQAPSPRAPTLWERFKRLLWS